MMRVARPRAVDFHCHLDLYPDHAALVRACDEHQIAVLAVTTTPKAFAGNLEAARASPYVRVAAGLHPQLVAERASELSLLLELLPRTRYVGEVGLDAGPQHFRSLDTQIEVFEQILKACGRLGGKVVTVHSVRAAKRVLDVVEARLPPDRGRVVLHWFSGTAAEARRAVELGCYFSVNEAMLATEKGRKLVAGLPLDRLITETDGPFLQVGRQSARPVDVMRCAPLLDALFERSDMNRIVLQNLRGLLAAVGAD